MDSGHPLVLRAPVGTIYYTLDGADPRAPGGAVSPAAKVFTNALALNEKANIFCRAHQDNRWSYPAKAKFTAGKTTAE